MKTAKQQLSRNPSNAGYATPLKTYSVPATTNPDGTLNVPAQPVYGIDPNVEPVDQYMAVRQYNSPGTQGLTGVAAGAIGAGGQVLGLGAGFKYKLQGLICDVVCTATVGNRTFLVQVRDVTGVILWTGTLSAATTAGQTGGYDVGFGAPINTPSTAVRRNIADTGNTNVQVRESCAITEMRAGGAVLIRDVAGIDNADAVTARLTYTVYPL